MNFLRCLTSRTLVVRRLDNVVGLIAAAITQTVCFEHGYDSLKLLVIPVWRQLVDAPFLALVVPGSTKLVQNRAVIIRRECWPCQGGVRRALLALLLVTLPAQAAEPIRLQVIPYQEWPKQYRYPYLYAPPPSLVEPAKPKKRRRRQPRPGLGGRF